MSYRKARKLVKERDSRGIVYRISYEIQAVDLKNFDLEYGADATWMTGEKSYVVKCKQDFFDPNYIVHIEAVNTDYNWSMGSGSNAIQVKEGTVKTYDIAAMLIDPKWFGIKRASREEAGWAKNSAGVWEFKSENQFLNITGQGCKINDWIYSNGTTENAGTRDNTESPFSNSSSLTDAVVNIIAGQQTNVTTYIVEFSTNQPINSLAYFQGVNGSFGSGMEPATTASGTWKAVGQTAREYTKDGVLCHRVVRKMVRAPKIGSIQLIWDSTHIGTWVW